MSARTEFVAADAANELAALQAEVKRLSGICETLIDAKLSQTEVNGDVRRRLAKLEQGQPPYNRLLEPAPVWGDSTKTKGG